MLEAIAQLTRTGGVLSLSSTQLLYLTNKIRYVLAMNSFPMISRQLSLGKAAWSAL